MPVAVVTGTNGKSTVTTFAGQLLAATGRRPWVGGNLGTPLSELAASVLLEQQGAPAAHRYDSAVVEVSSYQLELPGRQRLLLFRPLPLASPCSA